MEVTEKTVLSRHHQYSKRRNGDQSLGPPALTEYAEREFPLDRPS